MITGKRSTTSNQISKRQNIQRNTNYDPIPCPNEGIDVAFQRTCLEYCCGCRWQVHGVAIIQFQQKFASSVGKRLARRAETGLGRHCGTFSFDLRRKHHFVRSAVWTFFSVRTIAADDCDMSLRTARRIPRT
jgi:hypothetical protein